MSKKQPKAPKKLATTEPKTKPAIHPCVTCGAYPPETRPRKLNASIANQLIALDSIQGNSDRFSHRSDITAKILRTTPAVILASGSSNSGDFAFAEHWGIVERKPNDNDPTKKCSGYWRLTDMGRLFVRNRIRIAKYAHVRSGKVLRLDDSTTVSIIDCLGKRFDYSELMRDSVALRSNP